MYIHESTQQDIDQERRRLNMWQFKLLHVRDVRGIFMYDETGHPLYDKDKLPEMLHQIGCPLQVCAHKLTDFTNGQLLEAREVFEASFGEIEREYIPTQLGMALVGHVSTGKTTFAVAALRRAAWRGYTVKFIDIENLSRFFTTWIELSSNAKEYDDYADRADEWRRELWRMHMVYEVLVIDDIGRTKVPEFVYDELHSLLRSRTGNGCYTILTANKTLTEFGALVGESSKDFIRREFSVQPFVAEDKVV